MHDVIKNQKGRLPFKMVVFGLAVVLVLVSSGLVVIKTPAYKNFVLDMASRLKHESIKTNDASASWAINMPLKYSEPLTIASLGKILNILPVNANAVERVKTGENTIKYIEAYQNTDVELIKYPNKLKESIVLKRIGHPEEFVYQIGTIGNYDFEKDNKGNIIFYNKGRKGERLNKIFTLPAPYMVDATGKVSSYQEVATTLTADGYLTLRPNKEWLKEAVYPIVIDPTVEIHILNVQSYPTVGGPWEVRFTTMGQEDLIITGMVGNDYHTVFNTDIEFFELRCGEEIRGPIFNKNLNMYEYADWQCDETGYFISTVLLPGKHHLEFNFGGQIDNAYNDTTSFYDPAATGEDYNEWGTPTNAYASDNSYAGATAINNDQDYYNFSISLPAVNSIDGIQLDVECAANSKTITAWLSWDGGASQTASKVDTCTLTEAYKTYGGAADAWGRTWTTSELGNTNFRVHLQSNGAINIDHVRVQVTYTPVNSAPTVSTVTDAPDPAGVGTKVSFTVDWNDADSGTMAAVRICQGSGITTSTLTCKDGTWAGSDSYTNRDPEVVTYTTLAADKGNTRNYWAFACDNYGTVACSDGTAGTFTVANQRPDAPIRLLAEGMEAGNVSNITDITPEFKAIYKDSNDEGDTAEKYCVEVDTVADFSGTQMWATDSADCYTGTAIGSNVVESTFSPEFSYAGTALTMNGTVYYWRMWFWDGDERGATSTTGWFKMASSTEGAGVRLQGGRLRGGVRLK